MCSWLHHYSTLILGVFQVHQIAHVGVSVSRDLKQWNYATCALTKWQNFSAWKDIMAAILKAWRQIEDPTPSKNNSSKFHPDLIWNGEVLNLLFWRASPQHEEKEDQKQEQE